ncbi:hypothetical protein [Streptomyces clavuligerus]|uniref:Uncharacterized protein n=1 Tax=Streptomyces clavuligerus TaxID=1901 RepID=Q6TMT1_STRCL|nr:hypothetical protein [Streptomyces clavuligerus]AAQ93542.1 conserved hypothetical protein [Streptomyces clavuligerus]AXU16846.1 hypothetical protein D1794_29215 [Streptomyces clavuligerus]EDY48735.1 conserved hypothetical protein [Streptomyces clavuligerus]MBY6300980.1 hypothetical protein [Streptomyces clavuligerus]QPJ97009.1 hypothetical protein GE265_28255 [Streptomyces clavuligerus]
MTPIEELLARALLLDEPGARPDTVPPRTTSGTPDSGGLLMDLPVANHRRHAPASDTAADVLATLCEVVVSSTSVVPAADFVTEHLPAPQYAVLLGSVFQLVDRGGAAARYWWQYAAGAGSDTAAFLLHLHHLARGETYAAAWWCRQTGIDTRPRPETVPFPGQDRRVLADVDASTPTVLRVLSGLLADRDRARDQDVAWLLNYVPGAIGYAEHPDYSIPLLGEDFPVMISTLIATAPVEFGETAPLGSATRGSLPSRKNAREKPRPRCAEAWTAFLRPTPATHGHTA